MYNLNYVCKYTDDCFTEIEQDTQYRRDILSIFSLNTFDSKIITEEIDKIYDCLVKYSKDNTADNTTDNTTDETENNNTQSLCKDLLDYIKTSNSDYPINAGITIMYSFDYLYKWHPKLCSVMKRCNIQLE